MNQSTVRLPPYPAEEILEIRLNSRANTPSDSSARIVNPGKGFQSLRTAKPTLLGIEAFRTIKHGDLLNLSENPKTELRLVNQMFGFAA